MGTAFIRAQEYQNAAKLADNANLIMLPNQDTLQKHATEMKSGSPVYIETWGDSTYWGYVSGSEGTTPYQQVAKPSPVVMQDILRAYYGNQGITIGNQGVVGDTTSNHMATWDNSMSNSTASVIFINYCINDAKDLSITAEQYRDNLRSMVQTARKHGKAVVLETPNIVIQVDSSGYNMGTPSRSENIKQFAQVMREVAQELKTPMLDSYILTQWYLENVQNVSTAMPDGMHPSTSMYMFKGVQMAGMFMSPTCPRVTGETIIPAVSPSVHFVGSPATANITANSKVDSGLFAQQINVAIWVEQSGLDIYISTPLWNNGSSQMDIMVDDSLVNTISVNDVDFNAGDDYPLDMEFCVLENAPRGLHIIELNNRDAGANRQCGLYYVRTKKTRQINNRITHGSPSNIRQVVEALEGFQYTQTVAQETHIITDIPTSRFLHTIDIEVTAQLGFWDGFVILAHQTGTGVPRGGFLIFLNASGVLSYAEGGAGGYINVTGVGSTNYSTASHVYRLTCDTSGNITGYVDGTQVFTYTLTKKYWGGFLGFYRNAVGTSTISSAKIYR